MGFFEELHRILASVGVRVDPATFCLLFGLLLARVATAISVAPFLGGKAVSGRIKVGLAVLVSSILYPSVAPPAGAVNLDTLQVLALAAKEGAIGAALGFLAQVVFNAVQMAGALVDIERGMSQATFFAPQLESNVSLFGNLQFQAVLTLFLVLNGHLMFIRALASSFNRVPLLEFPRLPAGAVPVMEELARYSASALMVAVQLSAPVVLALFLVDVSFWLLGKAASGFQVHRESQPVKAMLGLGIVLLALMYILNRMPAHFAGLFAELESFLARIG